MVKFLEQQNTPPVSLSSLWVTKHHCGTIILARIVCSVCLVHRLHFLVTTGHLFLALSFPSRVILEGLSRWLLKVSLERFARIWESRISCSCCCPWQNGWAVLTILRVQHFEQQVVPFSPWAGCRSSSTKGDALFPKGGRRLATQFGGVMGSKFRILEKLT